MLQPGGRYLPQYGSVAVTGPEITLRPVGTRQLVAGGAR
jgi:hypothetical protein